MRDLQDALIQKVPAVADVVVARVYSEEDIAALQAVVRDNLHRFAVDKLAEEALALGVVLTDDVAACAQLDGATGRGGLVGLMKRGFKGAEETCKMQEA